MRRPWNSSSSDKLTSYKFIKTSKIDGVGDESKEDESGSGGGFFWVLKVRTKIRARVSSDMQLKMFGDQPRVDFVWNGVWAFKFFANKDYRSFMTKFQDCLLENVYGLKTTEDNKVKVYGKAFIGWVKPEVADDSMWEDADNGVWKSPAKTPARASQNLLEEFEEAATEGGIQSLALGACHQIDPNHIRRGNAVNQMWLQGRSGICSDSSNSSGSGEG